MVRSILDGRKTQTRRVIKPQPFYEQCPDGYGMLPPGAYWFWENRTKTNRGGGFANVGEVSASIQKFKCPYGQLGDRLWVRETFFIDDFRYHKGPLPKCWPDDLPKGDLYYRAEGTCCDQIPECSHDYGPWPMRPSIHMPRWASRITLEITSVRIERVQDISEEDAKAEGATPHHLGNASFQMYPTEPYQAGFARIWDSLNAERGFGWDANPWVWVIEFRSVDC